ncbi:MAG: hypothetical protein JJE51_14450 [Thermoanaerobaculia bacterium]|nr:hypothetical protein [Thermoanaerobaculia bacterium]
MRTIRTLSILLAVVALPLFADDTMTNADVIKLVKAGLTMNTIETKIYASNVSFDVSTDSLIELSRDGVPDQVVRAMIVRQSEQRGGAVPRTSTSQPAPKNLSRRFDVAVHKSKYAKCDGGELRIDSNGVRTSRCRGSNFDIPWGDVQGVCFDYGYRGVIVFRGLSRDYRVSTATPAGAKDILDTIAAVRPELSLRDTCD